MKAIMVMYDSLNRHMLPSYGGNSSRLPNFQRLADRTAVFDTCYVGSMPCIPARRELHTGRYNFLHRSWGPLEPFDDSMPSLLSQAGIYTHLVSDHAHYWEDGGATYHQRYDSWDIVRGQEADKWIGLVDKPGPDNRYGITAPMQQRTRTAIKDEQDFPQVRTFQGGLTFLNDNKHADNWFLQIETFDPHEPFFAANRFKELYGLDDDSDWPMYCHTSEIPPGQEIWYNTELVDHYQALLAMCDDNLGKVLDAMDELDLWKDTMLIVNTDHGFLLGEHDFFGKCFMPFYNQVANIPLFVWDPRYGVEGRHRSALVQTIDLAPTLLEYFGVPRPQDMTGCPLTPVITNDTPVHDVVLFGRHGEHVNITDGKHVCMIAPDPATPFYEYTLMPTHIHSFFTPEELSTATLVPPFRFSKGCPLLRTRGKRWLVGDQSIDGYVSKDELYDLQLDPDQRHNLASEQPEVMEQFRSLARKVMIDNDAPAENFSRYRMAPSEAV